MLRIHEVTDFESGSYGALLQTVTATPAAPGEGVRLVCRVCLERKNRNHGRMIYRPAFSPRPPLFLHDYEWVCFACVARIGTETVGPETYRVEALKARA
jgi:hypothetical protein